MQDVSSATQPAGSIQLSVARPDRFFLLMEILPESQHSTSSTAEARATFINVSGPISIEGKMCQKKCVMGTREVCVGI